MLDILRQLVDGEAAAARTQHSLDAAQLHLRQHPEALTSKIVAHFQQLFDVRSVDGIFPKMTEIYLTVNELGNFLKVLRSTLKLGACAVKNEQRSDHDPHNQSFCRIVSTRLSIPLSLRSLAQTHRRPSTLSWPHSVAWSTRRRRWPTCAKS